MKNFRALAITLASLCLLFAACGKDKDITTQYAKVKVHVNDFAITQEDLQTKDGVDPADYNVVKAIILALYEGETEVYKSTQILSDHSTYTTFGEFECDLTIGTYTLVAVAYAHSDGDEFFLTSPTVAGYTSERPRETFCATQSVTVTGASSLDLSVTLSRISSMLQIVSTDGRPAEATKIRTTYAKGGKGFNPTTGLSTTDNGFAQTNNPSSAAGQTVRVTSFPFLYTDEETMTVTIQALDANNNVLITKTVNNVPFKRNRKTILTGAVYTPGGSSVGFQLDTAWATTHNGSF